METVELEQWLDGGEETQTFDVKAAGPWDVRLMVKHILAMANVRDGGTILVGVEDKTFVRQGLSEADRASYELDTMRDQLSKYADPHVEVGVSFPRDRDGRVYAAIRVQSFREIPVICRVADEKAGVRAGVVYYRNSNRRPESAPVSNSYDMRDIITMAAMRTRARLTELGAVPAAQANLQARLDEELGEL